jgi:hypothetical protein
VWLAQSASRGWALAGHVIGIFSGVRVVAGLSTLLPGRSIDAIMFAP